MPLERWRPSQPHSAGPGSGKARVDPFANHFAFKLCYGAQDIKLELRGGILIRSVDPLAWADKRNAVGLKFRDELRQMRERPAQPVQLEAKDHVHLPSPHVGHQAIEPSAAALCPRRRIDDLLDVCPPSPLAVTAQLLQLAVVGLLVGGHARVDSHFHFPYLEISFPMLTGAMVIIAPFVTTWIFCPGAIPSAASHFPLSRILGTTSSLLR
jgi:hypothetical protein